MDSHQWQEEWEEVVEEEEGEEDLEMAQLFAIAANNRVFHSFILSFYLLLLFSFDYYYSLLVVFVLMFMIGHFARDCPRNMAS